MTKKKKPEQIRCGTCEEENAKYYMTPLRKVVDGILFERKKFYLDEFTQLLEYVYEQRPLLQIAQFESALVQFCRSVVAGKLENSVVNSDKEKPEEATKDYTEVDKRPKLTLYQYSKARDEGMTNEQIKEKFRMSSKYQMGGFAKVYTTRKKAQASQELGPKQE